MKVQIFLGFALYLRLASTAAIDEECNTTKLCGTNASTSYFRRHPTDCTKSYRCVNGAARIYSCSESRYFSEQVQTCTIPATSECPVECIDLGSLEEVTTEKPEVLECVFSRCPSPGSANPVYLPHSDCTKYCVCEGYSIRTLSCSVGLHFSSKVLVCDWPAAAQCASS